MMKEQLSPNTIGSRIATVKSFFKYNDLPLGHVPTAQPRVLYHNRDITHEEIKLILDASRPRERAFFAVMAQSGLRPLTMCNLKFKDIKEDFSQNHIPCKIDIPQEIAKGKYHTYFTFIGREAEKFLQSYLSVRPNMGDEDYIFLKQGTKERASPKSLSKMFGQTVQKLKNKGLIDVKQTQRNKPRDIRLYNLRKWFRKHANQAGFEFVQFWMGHIVRAGQDEHYRPRDVEFHRKLYAEKAMPFLRLETATPTQTDKTIKELEAQLAKRDKEINDMKQAITNLAPVIEFVNSFNQPKELKDLLDFLKDDINTDSDFRPLEAKFSPWIEEKLERIAKRKGITKKEALETLVVEDLEILERADERFREREAQARSKTQKKSKSKKKNLTE